jgi:hypothetical protein
LPPSRSDSIDENQRAVYLLQIEEIRKLSDGTTQARPTARNVYVLHAIFLADFESIMYVSQWRFSIYEDTTLHAFSHTPSNDHCGGANLSLSLSDKP